MTSTIAPDPDITSTRSVADRLRAWAAVISERPVVRRWLAGCYVALLGVLLWPALTVPIGTDDTYWVLESAPNAGTSVVSFLHWVFVDMGGQPETMGRFAEGSYVLQRLADVVTMDLAVATGLSPWVFRALLKVTLFAVAVWVTLALIRRLAVRDRASGSLVTLPAPAMTVVSWLVPLVVATGANAVWLGDINGWVDYPVLTYGGVAVMFGTPLLLLWATAAWTRGGWPTRLVVAVVLAGAGLFLNNSYELYYVAFPLGMIVLFMQGVSQDARRPRLVVAGIFTASFITFLLYYRIQVATICRTISCYDGSTFHLGPDSLRVFGQNLFGAFPNGAPEQVKVLLWHVDRTQAMPSALPPTYVAIGLAACAVTALLIWGPLARTATDAKPVLARIAVTGVLAALGAATLVSLNERVGGLLQRPGIPFRAGVMVWFGWSIAIVALVLWLALHGRIRNAVLLGLLACVTLAIGHVLPLHTVGARSYAALPAGQTVNAIHAEVAQGDRSELAGDRRCSLLETFYELHTPSNRRTRIAAGADLAFRHYHGQPFCSAKVDGFERPLGVGHPNDVTTP